MKDKKALYETESLIFLSDLTLEFKKLDLVIYGGWKWGPSLPETPHFIATLHAAKQVLRGELFQHLRKGSVKDFPMAIQTVENALRDFMAGVGKVEFEEGVTVRSRVNVKGISYEVKREVEWKRTDNWSQPGLTFTNTFTWNKVNDVIKKSFSFTSTATTQSALIAGRTTIQLFEDIIAIESLPYQVSKHLGPEYFLMKPVKVES